MAETIAVALERPPAASPATLRSMILPGEHGGWGLLAEPLLLGWIVAPSIGGAAVAVAAVSGFLCRHPARLALADRLRGARSPRTRIAFAYAAGFGAVAAAAGVAALALARGSLAVLIPIVAPLVAVSLAYDARLRGREAAAELAGALALAAGAPAAALAAGWPLTRALGLWLLLAGRSVGSVLEVRCRLRRQRGVPTSRRPVFVTAGGFGVAAAVGASLGALPAAAALVPAALWARSLWNLRSGAPPLRAQAIGWSEVRLGVMATLAWALCYRLS